MKRKLLFVPLLAMALAGCNTNDDVVNAPSTGSEGLVGVNTVTFTNNTSLVIGDGQTGSRSGVTRAANPAEDNAAYGLEMSESIDDALAEKGITNVTEQCFVVTGNGNYSEVVGENLGDNKYIYVPKGLTLTLDQDLESEGLTLFVAADAALIVNTAKLSGVEIQCWGILTLSSDVALYKSKIFALWGVAGKGVDVSIVDSSIYSGSDFTCKKITTYNAVMRVDGQLSYEQAQSLDSMSKFEKTSIYLDNSLTVDYLTLTDGSDLYVNCLLTVNSEMRVTASKVTALSILNKTAKLCQATIALPAAGCAKFEILDFVNYETTTNNYMKFENVTGNNVASGTQMALVACDDFRFYQTGAVEEFTLGEDVYLNFVTACLAYNYEPVSLSGDNINVEKVEYVGDIDGCHLTFNYPVEEPSYTDADVLLTIPTDIKEEWFLKADDFAIRVDGVYQEVIQVKDGVTALTNIKLTEEDLKVAVKGVENLEAETDYTYETWLWIDEDTWLNTFTESDRAAWVSGDGNGTDITDLCKIEGPMGYTVRKNVYKGLSGHADTPYIKVSIHITKDE